MTPDQLTNLHSWLYNALPLSAGDIMAELQIGHRAKLSTYAGLPADALELTKAMTDLQRQGLVEKRDGLWYWKSEPVKREPQMELFNA